MSYRYTTDHFDFIGKNYKLVNFSKLQKIVLDFVKYARGSEEIERNVLMYSNYRHDVYLSIKADNKSDLQKIQSLIKETDWAEYEKEENETLNDFAKWQSMILAESKKTTVKKTPTNKCQKVLTDKCQQTTKKGTQCSFKAKNGTNYCGKHANSL